MDLFIENTSKELEKQMKVIDNEKEIRKTIEFFKVKLIF